jgi:hypothetical protein
MDNATITFLNGLAQLLGLLPQKPQAATQAPAKGGALVPSPRGALATTPSTAITPSRGGLQASPGGAAQTGGGFQGVQVKDVTGSKALGGGGRAALGAGKATSAAGPAAGMGGRMGPLSGLAEIVGGALANEFIGKPLSGMIYDQAAQVPGTAASKGLVTESGEKSGGPLTRFAEPIGPTAKQGPGVPARLSKPQVTRAETDAAQEVAPRQDSPQLTKKQSMAEQLNSMYMEARSKAMRIEDPIEREAALEGVSQMGLEFHKEYYGKPDPMKGRK